MMFIITLSIMMLICAVVPALLFVANLKVYDAPQTVDETQERVSVLIPARNEERNIGDCIAAVLQCAGSELEIFVLDDASTDSTAEIVLAIASRDDRVQLLRSTDLPSGWNGKQYACWQLAEASSSPVLLFVDADVRLQPSAIGSCVAELRRRNVALLSGFPRLITIGPMEWLLLPLIHFVLLGFLPLGRMRSSTDPSFSAGCGQFMMVERGAYFACGGHSEIRSTMHDGLLLPRAFRRAGFCTDLVDLTRFAEVRMYDSAKKVWQGLAKNATEGMAAPKRIVPISIFLVMGQIAPAVCVVLLFVTLVLQKHQTTPETHSPMVALCSTAVVLALVASYLPGLLAIRRFSRPVRSMLLHPLGILLLLCVQWYALMRQLMGAPVEWRQREYSLHTSDSGP